MGLRKQKASDNAGSTAFDSGMSRFLMPKSKVKLYEPQYDGKLPTALKILPEFDSDTGEPLPYRTSADPSTDALGSWRMPLPIIKWAGTTDKKKKLSCILFDPQEDREAGGELKENNPYNVLRDNVKQAAYNNQSIKYNGRRYETETWLKYFTGTQEQRAFSMPQVAAFVPCVFYTTRGEPVIKNKIPLGLKPDDVPHMILLTAKLSEAVDALCCETTDAHRTDGTPEEYDDMFTYGDVTRIDGGKILIICNAKPHEFSMLTGNEDDNDVLVEPAKQTVSPYVPGFFDRIMVKEDKKKLGFTPDISAHMDVIKRNAIDWFDADLFQIPDLEKLLMWLVAAFEPTPQILEFGWRNYPDYWGHDVVQRAIKKRTQGFVPGAADTDDEDSDSDDDDEVEDVNGSTAKERNKKAVEAGKATRTKANPGSSVYDTVASDIAETEPAEEEKPVAKPKRLIRRKK